MRCDTIVTVDASTRIRQKLRVHFRVDFEGIQFNPFDDAPIDLDLDLSGKDQRGRIRPIPAVCQPRQGAPFPPVNATR